MKSAVKRSIDPELIPLRGKKLLCAVSGGADSMCLLHLLWRGGFDVAAAHFEHGIRGAESLRDAAFVEEYCRACGIPFFLGRGDAPKFAEEKGLSLEQAARELRYAFLEETADAIGASHILTAHTLDDNAETLLFNLVRGSGTPGITGIPKARGRILRPLLGVSRGEIMAYLRDNAVPHVEDSTNETDDYTRNLIRHRVIPVLKEINPRFPEAAARAAALAARDEDCLAALADDFIGRETDGASLPLAAFRALHPAVASRVVRKCLPGLSMAQVEDVLSFAQGSEYALLDLPGRRLRREQGRLWLSPSEEICIPPRGLVPGEAMALPEAGLSVSVEIVTYGGEIHDLFKTSYLKCEILCPDLLCSGRLPGDSIRPAGRGCTKKLSALFKEAGYTRAERDRTPVIRDDTGPLWVRGLALAERALPRPGERALKISFSEI